MLRRLRQGASPIAAATLVAFAVPAAIPLTARAQAARVPSGPDRTLPPGRIDAVAASASPDAPVTSSAGAPASTPPGPVDLDVLRRSLERVYGQAGQGTPAKAADTLRDEAPATVGRMDEKWDAKDGKTITPLPTAPTVSAEGLPTADRTGVTGTAISVPKGEATVQGMGESFSAQLSTGIATYTVPFALPDARGDAQPSLGLSYSSSGGFGVAGVGFSLGVAFIARQTDRGTPLYQDQAAWHPEQDRFVFNGGQELVPICLVAGAACTGMLTGEKMPGWASGWQYFRPRVEGSFLRFFWSSDHRTWRVQAKSGVTMELGVPLDGSVDSNGLEQNPANPAEIFRWLLTREYDASCDTAAAGCPPVNAVRYRYLNDGGTAYLADVYDTPPVVNGATAPLSLYAHHTRLFYEDRTDRTHSYRSGWRIDQSLRLARVDVTSMPFVATNARRELLRRYHLGYDPSFHGSFLAQVTVEGRCAATSGTQITENTDENLPDSGPAPNTACPTLPAMTFRYTHVKGQLGDGTTASASISGYEPFDERVQSLASSPDYSLDDAQTALQDIDADGLPDVLVTAPGFFGGNHGVYLNGQSGVAGQFTATTMGVKGVLGANANTLTLGNLNVVPLDFDGDATVDLVHMPLVSRYAVYSPVRLGGELVWQGRAIDTADSLNPKIDLGRDASFIKVVDVNFDGLVDVVRSTGTQLETYLSLGRYPGGDGRFGHAKRTGASTADLFTDPIVACLPWSGTGVSFADKDISLADMNGDGIVDIVRVRPGDLRYWPGRGNGFWGTGSRDDCPGDTFGQGRDIQMGTSPYYSDVQGDSLRLDDVNGDGLADLVQVRFQDVDVWLNIDGAGFTAPHTIHGTPASPSYANRVRLTDINGSGTPDILWGDAGHYKYVDLAGGLRPGVLSHVENGLGKTTDLEYGTSVAEMLAAKRSGTPWQKVMPIVAAVVKRVVVSDNLVIAVSRPKSADVTEYTYTDPVYDGRQREFRGFRKAMSRRAGDANSPAETTTSTFLLGECADETPTNGVDECSAPERWRDNPREALKGLAFLTERMNDSGVYLSTATTQYQLRELYQGLDGRRVRHALTTLETNLLYDTASFDFINLSLPTVVASVEAPLGAPIVEAITESVTQRSLIGTGKLVKSPTIDAFGNSNSTADLGCTTSGAPCDQFTEDRLTSLHPVDLVGTSSGGWLFRPSGESVSGLATLHTQPYGQSTHTYDDQGHLTLDRVTLMGTVDLVRNQSDSASFPPRSSGTTAPVSIDLHSYGYDKFGNVIHETGANLRCRDVTYDSSYAQLPVSETVYSGGCGVGPLPSFADNYDRGLALPTLVHDVSGQATSVEYDRFGRLSKLFKPNALATVPSTTVDYFLPGPGGPAYSRVHVSVQDGADVSTPSYLESWSYVDGLGRTVATLKEAEAGTFIVSGLTDFDNKSKPRTTFLEFGIPSATFNPADAPPSTALVATQSYDPFGRPFETRDYCGRTTLQERYHALAVEHWDTEDLSQVSTHANTPTTEQRDGHGRVVRTAEQFKSGSIIDERRTQIQYLPTGAPELITRTLKSGGASVSRYLVYDTLGRMVINVEPNTSAAYVPKLTPNKNETNVTDYPTTLKAWRYRYDDAGDLVGVSDARGCGANFFYDGLGRLTLEDLFPCISGQHAAYSVPTFTAGVATAGAEVAYEYDALSTAPKPAGWAPSPALLKGRLARVRDLGKHSLFGYDARGNVTQTAVQLATPGATAVNAFASRYAARWYNQATTYDAADRAIVESTGAQVAQLLGAGPASTVSTVYGPRGTVQSVTSSYGTLVDHVTRDPDGFVTQIQYGDVANTKTDFAPDSCRRLDTVMTYRGPPNGVWPPNWETQPPGTFQLTLEHQQFLYDLVSNPVKVNDLRAGADWPAGAKPVSRTMTYDDFYRVTNVAYSYQTTSTTDTWQSPYADELAAFSSNPTDPQSVIDPRRALPTPHVSFPSRAISQTTAYDWLGNMSSTSDDASGFYDRSLGGITNGTAAAGPYALKRAAITTGTRSGELTASYDLAGNLLQLNVDRNGTCVPNGNCSQVYKYEWDELGRLTRARRWDRTDLDADAPPAVTNGTEVVDLRYRYDADDERVLKSSHDIVHATDRHTAYIFDSLELRRAPYNAATANDYDLTQTTEVPYLFANGVRLARVVYEPDPTVPQSGGSSQHVLFELGDHLGSTSTVLDKASSELVERSTYQAYGAAESDYRPDRWNAVREDYRFTGKEEDVEVGLVYFGKRFLNPVLGRWVSPDPLGLHDAGKGDLNLYAYVHGHVLKATDPLGLQSADDHVNLGDPADKDMAAREALNHGDATYTFGEDQIAGQAPTRSVAGFADARVTQMQHGAVDSALGMIEGPLRLGAAATDSTVLDSAASIVRGMRSGPPSDPVLRLSYDDAAFGFNAATIVSTVVLPELGFGARMSSAPIGSRQMVLSGHGSIGVGTAIVPEGTTLTLWGEHGNVMYNDVGNMLEDGLVPSLPASRSGELEGSTTHLPGSVVPNYVLHPPGDLRLKGGVTAGQPTQLQELLQPNMGCVTWAACRGSTEPGGGL